MRKVNCASDSLEQRIYYAEGERNSHQNEEEELNHLISSSGRSGGASGTAASTLSHADFVSRSLARF